MATYPVTANRKSLVRDPRKREKAMEHNRAAQRIEKWLNDQVRACTDEGQEYGYHAIAHAVGVDVQVVRAALFGPGGHNGITIYKTADRRADDD